MMQQEHDVQMLGGAGANQQQHQMALPAPMMPGLDPAAHCGCSMSCGAEKQPLSNISQVL